MEDVAIIIKDDSISYEEILNVVHKAFEGRLSQGMHFTAVTYDLEKIKEIVDNGTTFCAIINGKCVGTLTLNIRKDKHNKLYGYISTVAVDPSIQGRGIGYKMKASAINKAKEMQCEYILGNTSIFAKDVKRINEKFGYKIIGYASYSTTNYYSYVFRLQLSPSLVWNNALWLRIHFFLSYIKCKMFKNPDGSYKEIWKTFISIKDKHSLK